MAKTSGIVISSHVKLFFLKSDISAVVYQKLPLIGTTEENDKTHDNF